MSNMLKKPAHIALALFALNAGVANAYMDERTKLEPATTLKAVDPIGITPLTATTAPTSAPMSAVSPVGYTPTPEIHSIGNYGQPSWQAIHNLPKRNMPVADALIFLHFTALGHSVELEPLPDDMAQLVIPIEPNISRKQAIDSISSQAHIQINYSGKKITVSPKGNGLSPSTTYDVATVQAAQPVAAAPVRSTWSLSEGKMLSDELNGYAAKNNIKVIWKADVDYKIAVGFSMSEGTPIKTIQSVLALYEKSSMPLEHQWYGAQGLLIIQDKSTY